jgi:hypothetical protein
VSEKQHTLSCSIHCFVDGNKHFKIANVFSVPKVAFPGRLNSLELSNAFNLITSEWAIGVFNW